MVNDDIEITAKPNTSAVEKDLVEVTKTDKLQEAYNQLFSDKNLSKITELNRNEVAKISILKTYADKFGFTELSSLIDNFLRYRVSLDRKGRTEHVNIASAEIVREEKRLEVMERANNPKNRG